MGMYLQSSLPWLMHLFVIAYAAYLIILIRVGESGFIEEDIIVNWASIRLTSWPGSVDRDMSTALLVSCREVNFGDASHHFQLRDCFFLQSIENDRYSKLRLFL